MNQDYTINRKRTQNITNPADLSALSIAVEWRNRMGGEVVCVTMGAPSAESSLREAALAGADRLYHICDSRIAGADTLVTARILTAFICHLGGADAVFCGNSSVDGETGQVGAEMAALLDYGCIRQVLSVDHMDGEELVCSTCSEEGTEVFRVSLPVILCVCAFRTVTDLPTLAALRRADRMPVSLLALEDIGLPEVSGKTSSCTKVIKTYPKEHRRRHTEFITGPAGPALLELIRREVDGCCE